MRTATQAGEPGRGRPGAGASPGRALHAVTEGDLTARARIRDAALVCFAQAGFDVPVRAIAASAGVSPGLITHHFGSKEALREECDAEVLRRYRVLKEAAIAQPTSQMLAAMADTDQHGPILLYILRSLQSGGPAGRVFVDHLVDDARDYMRQGVASGVIKPSRDEEARLRYLTSSSLGALLIEFTLADRAEQGDLKGAMGRHIRDTILPTLELFTEGLLASSEMLDGYLAYEEDNGPLWGPDVQPPAPASPSDGSDPPGAGPAA